MNTNLYIMWNENNNFGIPIIDEQHKGIVSAINSLHYYIAEGQEGQVLKSTMDIIKQYTIIHFTTEQNLLKKSKYPKIKEHIRLHRRLQNKTLIIGTDAIKQRDASIALKFLKKWWLNHINIEDRKYVPHVKGYLNLK